VEIRKERLLRSAFRRNSAGFVLEFDQYPPPADEIQANLLHSTANAGAKRAVNEYVLADRSTGQAPFEAFRMLLPLGWHQLGQHDNPPGFQ
jgi:hypothetical protein